MAARDGLLSLLNVTSCLAPPLMGGRIGVLRADSQVAFPGETGRGTYPDQTAPPHPGA